MPTTASQPVTDVPTGIYTIDTGTPIEFTTATHLFGLGAVRGTFALLSGATHVAAARDAVTATVSIDSASFHTGTSARDKKVRGKAFLDSGRHPSIDVTVEQVDRDDRGGDRLTGHGTLTVRGTSAPIDITITDLQVSGDTLRAQLSARIDRYAHGITAARGVADRHLDVRVQLVATRQN
jgi:polyisoprenoid-binding protein YceI